MGVHFLWAKCNNQVFNEDPANVHGALIRFWRRMQSYTISEHLSNVLNHNSSETSFLCCWRRPGEGLCVLKYRWISG